MAGKATKTAEFDVEAFLGDLGAVFAAHGLVNGSTAAEEPDEEEAPAKASKGKAKGKGKASKVDAKRERYEELVEQSQSKKGLKALMAACVEAGYDEDEFEDAEPDDFVTALMSEEFGDNWADGLDIEESDDDDEDEEEPDEDEEEEEDEDEEEEDDDEEGYTREALEKMNLKELKGLATTDEDDGGFGYSVSDLKGLNKSGIIDLLVGFTEESLNERSLGELKEIAKNDFGLKVTGVKKPDLIEAILEAQAEGADEEEDEEEDDDE